MGQLHRDVFVCSAFGALLECVGGYSDEVITDEEGERVAALIESVDAEYPDDVVVEMVRVMFRKSVDRLLYGGEHDGS